MVVPPPRALLTRLIRARVDRDPEVFVQRRVSTDDRAPRKLGSVPPAFLRHLDALGTDGNGVHLPIELQLTLDRLVELRRHAFSRKSRSLNRGHIRRNSS